MIQSHNNSPSNIKWRYNHYIAVVIHRHCPISSSSVLLDWAPFFLSSFSPENPSCLQWHPYNTPAESQLLRLLFVCHHPSDETKDILQGLVKYFLMSFKLRKIIIIPIIMRCTRRQWNSCNQLLLRWHAKRGRKGSVKGCVMIAVSGFGHKGNGIVENSKTAFVLCSVSAHIVEQSPPT